VEAVAELGRHHPVVRCRWIAADQGLGQMIAVAFAGVDQVHAKLPGPPEQRVDLLLDEASPPLAAKLPACK